MNAGDAPHLRAPGHPWGNTPTGPPAPQAGFTDSVKKRTPNESA